MSVIPVGKGCQLEHPLSRVVVNKRTQTARCTQANKPVNHVPWFLLLVSCDIAQNGAAPRIKRFNMVRKGSSSKAKAKAASKASAKAKTVRGAASSKAPAQTLLEQDGRASGPSASTQTVVRRALKRQTFEAQAHKAIRDNFKGWSDLELNAVVYEDLNLFQRLRRDKRAKMDDPSIPMGATYYLSLHPWLSSEHADMSMDVLLWCVRNNIAGKHAEYFKKVMPHVDKILECRWQQCRKENVDADEFWSLFRGPLSLIVK